MYKVVEKKECPKCKYHIGNFCEWGNAKKGKKIVQPKGKTKSSCKLIKK